MARVTRIERALSHRARHMRGTALATISIGDNEINGDGGYDMIVCI